jgi:hypothetical protein
VAGTVARAEVITIQLQLVVATAAAVAEEVLKELGK